MNETPEDRSRIMRAVKARDTGPELVVRRIAHGLGYRYRLHGIGLPGKPDLVFTSRKKVIFVHGCFWHGHDCPRGARMPKSNRDYWKKKITGNRSRDRRHCDLLNESGWEVLVVWECSLSDPDSVAQRLESFLGKPSF